MNRDCRNYTRKCGGNPWLIKSGEKISQQTHRDSWPGPLGRAFSLAHAGLREPSALDQDRSGALRPFALAHDAQSLGDFGIGFQQPAEVATETVLVELLV
jgi:hypothetical protein